MPFVYKTKVTYQGVSSLSTHLAGVSAIGFSLNSIFDPDASGVGTQPMGYDQLMAFYVRYGVESCRARVRLNPLGTSGTMYLGGFFLDTDASAGSISLQAFSEKSRGSLLQWRENAYQGPVQISKSFDMRSLFGVDNVLAKDSLCGNTTANPADQMYILVWAGCADGSSGDGDTEVVVELEYSVTFFDPREVPTS
jgi:hypothetical protein